MEKISEKLIKYRGIEEKLMKKNIDYIEFPFIKNGLPLEITTDLKCFANAPVCCMTLRAAGSMKFRWETPNHHREEILSSIERQAGNKIFVPVELNHTHTVYDVHSAIDTKGLVGDGIITKDKNLIPTVTVADCMPIYLYEPVTGVFGIVHSGWKGTGIVVDAINLAKKKYGVKAENFCIAMGPHIRSCCYIVNQERAAYFSENFTPDCVEPLSFEQSVKVAWNNGGGKLYRLSLEKANIAIIKKAGVLMENIFVHQDCTCCSKDCLYGSNRRETSLAGKPDVFTVQAAYIKW